MLLKQVEYLHPRLDQLDNVRNLCLAAADRVTMQRVDLQWKSTAIHGSKLRYKTIRET
jgi:hypothetical protein